MLDAVSILNFIQNQGLLLLFKVLLLLVLFVYAIFAFIVISRVKTLNHTVSLAAARASSFIVFFASLFFILAVSLFLITLVIV